MKTLWQRALGKNGNLLVGRKLWVRAEKPHMAMGQDVITGKIHFPVRCVYCHILDKNGKFYAVRIDDIELLGGPENFSTDVRPITIEMWEYTREGVDL